MQKSGTSIKSTAFLFIILPAFNNFPISTLNKERATVINLNYPKSSNIIISDGTPRLSSIRWAALAIGPGPHM